MIDFELRLQPVVSLPIVIGLAAVLIGLLWVRPRHVRLTRRQMAALIGLRLLVVLLTLFAMLRPTIVYTREDPVKASLVVLADGSRSMQVADSLGDKSRWNAMKGLLDSSAKDMAKLSAKWDVTGYAFSDDIKKLELRDGKFSFGKTPDGDQSAIGAAIADALDHETGKRLLGVFVLSDGAQRAAPPRDLPPQSAARRLAAENIPLYTFSFGKPGGRERADLAIDDLVTNETIFTDTPVEVRGLLTADGYTNQQVKVQLLWEMVKGSQPRNNGARKRGEGPDSETTERWMEVVDTAQVDTGVDGGSMPVALHHTPKSPGEYKITLKVEPREGELVTTNNEVSTFVTVRAGGINVMYLVGAKRVGGGPGQEQRFVRAALAQSPDIDVDRRLIRYEPPDADMLEVIREAKPDVMLLDDVDMSGLSGETWQVISERVREGMGLMMLGGYHSYGPGGFRDSPLADVLPLDIGPAERQAFGEKLRDDVHLPGPVRMVPSGPLGARHPVMQLEASGTWEKLPQLDGANRISQGDLKPNALVLAEADDADRHPLLVAGQSGDGRVLAFAGDSTWRWQMAGFGEAHRRFWRQCVLWLAKKDEQTDGRVWIRLAGRRVARGAPVEFAVGLDDAHGNPIDTAEFDVSIESPSGNSDSVRATKGTDGWGATYRGTSKPGDYRIRVTAKDNGKEAGTAEARFLVPAQDMELDRPAAEPGVMAQLAESTKLAGGESLAPEELPDLLKRLADKPPEVKESVVARVTYWDTWPFFLMFVALIGTEWFLRKRWGLA